MRLSKLGINLCVISRHRPLRREFSYGPRDTDAELPELRTDHAPPKPKPAYASPHIQQKPPNPPDKVAPKDARTKKIVPMPDLAHLLTYCEMFKNIKPFWQKYIPKIPWYGQVQLPWKKY